MGKNLYLFLGLRWWSLCVSESKNGQSLSAEPCLVADSPMQLAHLGGLSGVGQRLVWWLSVQSAHMSVIALHSEA